MSNPELKAIKVEISAINKQKIERIRQVNAEFDPLYKEIQSRCPHELSVFRQDMFIGYSIVERCFWCDYSREIERII